MYSSEHQCLFIHIPKTAGTSIEKKLGHFTDLKRNVQDHRTFCEFEPYSWGLLKGFLFGGNLGLARKIRNGFRGQESPSKEEFHGAFKFTFVRNPWARVFSWYRNAVGDEFHRQNLGISADCSFGDFLTDHPNQWALRPQLYWLLDSGGKLSLDFIGKFENLAQDFEKVAREIGLEDPHLPHLISGNGGSYREAFNDQSREWVAKKYAEEIQLFGYSFDE